MSLGIRSKLKRIIFGDRTEEQKLLSRIQELEEQLNWFKQNTDITKIKKASGYFRKRQLELVAFAEKFFEDTKELGITPFLVGGNLIGAVRHQGFVPWDDDLDFGVTREDANKIIAYCQEHGVVDIWDGRWSEYSYEQIYRRMQKNLEEHPGKYILDVWVNQLQLYSGTSAVDVQYLDFWPFDYYKEGYPIEEHMAYLENLLNRLHGIDRVDEIVAFLKKERINNPNISIQPTSVFFPGIDDQIAYGRIKRTKQWLQTDIVFPLQKVKYEDSEFWAPNDIQGYLSYEYPNYMEYPNDVGQNPHITEQFDCMGRIVPTVAVYAQTENEIPKLFQIHDFFEKHGIFSFFVFSPETDAHITQAVTSRRSLPCGKDHVSTLALLSGTEVKNVYHKLRIGFSENGFDVDGHLFASDDMHGLEMLLKSKFAEM